MEIELSREHDVTDFCIDTSCRPTLTNVHCNPREGYLEGTDGLILLRVSCTKREADEFVVNGKELQRGFRQDLRNKGMKRVLHIAGKGKPPCLSVTSVEDSSVNRTYELRGVEGKYPATDDVFRECRDNATKHEVKLRPSLLLRLAKYAERNEVEDIAFRFPLDEGKGIYFVMEAASGNVIEGVLMPMSSAD